MDIFGKIIGKVGLDRIAHFGVGAALFSFVFSALLPSLRGSGAAAWLVPAAAGYAVTAAAAWLKERGDASPDRADIAATLLGAAFVHCGALLGLLAPRAWCLAAAGAVAAGVVAACAARLRGGGR